MVNSIYHKLIPWIGKNILNLEKDITQFSGGSGNTTYDYVLLLFFIFCAVIGTILWTVVEKKDKDYGKINYIFTIVLSYYLGAMMLSYGLAKIIPPRQFSELSFYRLLQPYGESSPMGLLWTFMGASQGYTVFSGLAETIGGLLLFHRKSRLLGSLILIPVLANVVALNFFYDVPVKLFSVQLLIFAIFITLPDANRLINVVVLNKMVRAKAFKKYFIKGKMKTIRLVGKYGFLIVIFGLLFYNIIETLNWAEENGYGSEKPPSYGVYKVTNQNSINTNKERLDWNYIRIQYDDYVNIHRKDLSVNGYEAKIDTLKKVIVLKSAADSTNTFKMIYKEVDSLFVFTKVTNVDTLNISTKKMLESDFLLVNRGFNWINEIPF